MKKYLFFVIAFLSFLLVSCDNFKGQEKDKIYTVNFVCNEQTVRVTEVLENHVLTKPTDLTVSGYEIESWYLDQEYTSEYQFTEIVTSDLTLFGKLKTVIQVDYVTIFYISQGEEIFQEEIIKGSKANPFIPEREGFIFDNWYLDDSYENLFKSDEEVVEDLILYAKWTDKPIILSFDTLGGEALENLTLTKNQVLPSELPIPQKEYYIFAGWYYDDGLTRKVDYTRRVYNDLTLYASWEKDFQYFYEVKFNLGDNCWNNKDELRRAFYQDFYNFILENFEYDFAALEINSFEDFDAFCMNWTALGRSDLYAVGDCFKDFFLTQEEDGLLENQPTSTFIGYCYQNGKYVDFLPHLITFFAYWRTDEGYTTPNNHGNDFFYSPWAALVDTAKFFYFTADTLNLKYAWFNSERVKNALDNIPGVLSREDKVIVFIGDEYILPTDVSRSGYKFIGWYTEDDEAVEKVNKGITVYAKWEKE